MLRWLIKVHIRYSHLIGLTSCTYWTQGRLSPFILPLSLPSFSFLLPLSFFLPFPSPPLLLWLGIWRRGERLSSPSGSGPNPATKIFLLICKTVAFVVISAANNGHFVNWSAQESSPLFYGIQHEFRNIPPWWCKVPLAQNGASLPPLPHPCRRRWLNYWHLNTTATVSGFHSTHYNKLRLAACYFTSIHTELCR